MNRRLLIVFIVLASACSTVILTLSAQALPVTLHAEWDPNVASDSVTSYLFQLDAQAAQTVDAATCAAVCRSAPFQITDQSPHTVSIIAVNAFAQSAPALLSFQVKVPATVLRPTIKR